MDWNAITQGIQALGSIVSATVAVVVVAYVHQYTKGKDRTEFLRNVWHEQQEINLVSLGNYDAMETFERMVYGVRKVDKEEATKNFHIFLVLDRTQQYYFGWQNGVLERSEYEVMCKRSLKLIKREEE